MTETRTPNPRKYPQLWQSYLWWEELMLMRQRHTLRLKAIEDGRSNMDETFERGLIEGRVVVQQHTKKGTVEKRYDMVAADDLLAMAVKIMVNYGTEVPCWGWITGIKGLGAGSQAAKILALIDDIGRFDTVAKLWRYAGYGLYEYYAKDGAVQAPVRGKEVKRQGTEREIVAVEVAPKAGWEVATVRDRGITGYVLPYNKTLKSTLFVMADGFIKQQTPGYTDLYYAEKQRQRALHPEKIVENGVTKFNDGHINNRAIRKMIKEFLKDLWVEWRVAEGLSVNAR